MLEVEQSLVHCSVDMNIIDWRALVSQRKGTVLKDWEFNGGLAKALGILAFKHAPKDDKDWPAWNKPTSPTNVGIWTASSRCAVRRHLHGYQIVFACGRMTPAHAARLSDMVEHVFGKYRIDSGRAAWNYSKEQAELDCLNETFLYDILVRMQKRLVAIEALPTDELLGELKLAPAAPPHRRTDLQILSDRLDALEKAATDALEELRDEIGFIKDHLKI